MESFQSLDQTDHFPEMVRLLKEVRDYRGEGLAAKLFYNGKVAEAWRWCGTHRATQLPGGH